MSKVFLEYIWLDGNEPQQLRSKTKVIKSEDLKSKHTPSEYPIWSFDGSSTKQTESGAGVNTDCMLKPVYIINDPFRGGDHKLVFCEVYNPDGETPHKSNKRSKLVKRYRDENKSERESEYMDKVPWFGWEQEYTLTHNPIPFSETVNDKPLAFSTGNASPRPQADYYCGVGFNNVIGRNIVEEHLNKCVEVGLEISGVNAEVMVSQWEYQIGPVAGLNGSDQLWMSRYLLYRVAEEHGVMVSLHPKPVKSGEWNGSGCHVNVSTKETRSEGGLDEILSIMGRLSKVQQEHIDVYGVDNDERMVSGLETSDISEFTFGYSTRDTSVRIPLQTKNEGKGYFEDRRPASNCDPYMVTSRMLETVYNTEKILSEV